MHARLGSKAVKLRLKGRRNMLSIRQVVGKKKNQRHTRKFLKTGRKRIKDRQEKTQRQARKEAKAGKTRRKDRRNSDSSLLKQWQARWLDWTQRQARFDSKIGKIDLKGRQDWTQRRARKDRSSQRQEKTFFPVFIGQKKISLILPSESFAVFLAIVLCRCFGILVGKF
jgi:hypothetical protein